MPTPTIISGEPGTSFVNDTAKILWQFDCKFKNSCGLCIQFAGRIGHYWPIPLHLGCNCRNISIRPGATAAPFVDFQAEIAALDPPEQARVIGVSNWRLVSSGAVEWADVVTKARIRDFREVVAIKGFDVDRLVKLGVTRHNARTAYEAVHTAGHAAADATRAALIKALRSNGMTDEAIKAEVARLLAGRVSVSRGPEGPTSPPLPAPRPKPPSGPPPAAPAVARPPRPSPSPAPAVAVDPATARLDMLRGRVAEEVARIRASTSAAVAEHVSLQEALREAVALRKAAEANFADAATLGAATARVEERQRKLWAASAALVGPKKRLKALESWEADRAVIPNLLPPLPIAERLKLYEEGDRKVKALAELGAVETARRESAEAMRRELIARMNAAETIVNVHAGRKVPEGRKAAYQAAIEELDAVHKALRVVRAAINAHGHRVRERAAPILAVDRPATIHYDDPAGAPGLVALTERNATHVAEAREFLAGKLAAGDSAEFRVKAGNIPEATEQRDYELGGAIHLSTYTQTTVVVHETGHAIDHLATVNGRKPADVVKEFLDHRVGDEVPRPMADVSPGSNYGPEELGRKDRFADLFGSENSAYYTGKVYPGDVSEITAMGLQELYADAGRFAAKDPEFCKFILGVLDGSIR